MLTVNFGQLGLSDFASVDLRSMNTGGEAFESAALQWLDASGNTIGTANYNGFWANTASVGTTVNGDVITNSADVWTAEDTGTINFTTNGATSDNPGSNSSGNAGSNGVNDNAVVSASTYLGTGVLISGYKVTRWLEDVATVEEVLEGQLLPTQTLLRLSMVELSKRFLSQHPLQ